MFKVKDVKPNILIVSSEFPPLPGGIGNHAHNLATHLQHIGYSVSVLADYRNYDQKEEDQFDGEQPYTVVRITRKKNRWGMYWQRIKTYRKLLSKADLVVATGKFPLWLVGFGTWGYSILPKLAILHGSEVNFQKKGLKWSIEQALKRFDQAIAVSRFTAQLVRHLGLKITVIPNGINFKEWEKELTPQENNIKAFPILVTVGNLTERKGQAHVIGILPHLLKLYSGIRYDCIGLPTEMVRLKQLARELGVSDRVNFYGRVSPQELKERLGSSDVFVMLSNQTASGDVEGFGIAILEANALGIPAIGTKGSGIEDAILDGTSGFLVNKEDPEGFAKALESILSRKEQFRTGALQWAQKHDWKIIVKHYQEVIGELIRETK